MTANLFRTAVLEVTADKATDSVCVATEALAVPRDIRGQRIREHIDLAASDLSVLNNRAPLLFDHDPGREAGECVPGTFRVDPGQKLRGSIRWYPEFREVRTELLDGKRPNYFSVGYDWTRETHREQRGDGLHVWFAVKFFEVSNLSPGHLPADQSAGLYRSKNMNASLDQILQAALSGSRQTEESFNDVSLAQTIRELGRAPTGRVREMHQSLTHLGGEAIDRGIPFSAFDRRQTRDSTAGIFSAGGALVQDDMHAGTPLLFSASVTRRLGAQFVTGLQGNFLKPRGTTAPKVEALSETALVTASDILTAQDALKPMRLAAQVVLSNQWLVQAGPSAEAYVRQTIAEAVATEMDRLVQRGVSS